MFVVLFVASAEEEQQWAVAGQTPLGQLVCFAIPVLSFFIVLGQELCFRSNSEETSNEQTHLNKKYLVQHKVY